MNTFQKHSPNFEVEVISRGSFVDYVEDRAFIIETHTIRLNDVAMDEWIRSEAFNTRQTYDTKEEWLAYRAKKDAERKVVESKIKKAMGLVERNGQIATITDVHSEVLAVFYSYAV